MGLRAEVRRKVLYRLLRGPASISEIAGLFDVKWETAEGLVKLLEEKGLVAREREGRFPFRTVVRLTERGMKVAEELLSEEWSKLGPQERLLLALLYALGGEVRGATRLEKLVFLLENEDEPSPKRFHFFACLHGPYAPEVMKATYVLAYHGLIDIIEEVVRRPEGDEEVVRKTFKLTDRGRLYAEKVFSGMPRGLKERLEGLRRFNEMPLPQLLDYVYSKYPDLCRKYTTLDRWIERTER